MKIGILGGTFDPIHIGHLLLGEFAYENFSLDEIWFLLNGNPPHKETLETKQALLHRIEMVKRSIQDVPYFRLNLHEADQSRHSYTYQTMQAFNRKYPNDRFYFILGADSLFSIEQWMNFRDIFPTCTILAAMRDDKDTEDMQKQIDFLQRKYGADIRLLQAPLVEISSTTIRRRAAEGRSIRYLVPDVVAEYIRGLGLYRE